MPDGVGAIRLASSISGWHFFSAKSALLNTDYSTRIVMKSISLLLLCGIFGQYFSAADVCSVPTFAPARTFNAEGATRSVAIGDLNRDGKMDLAVATSIGVSVLLGEGDGNFRKAVNFVAGTNPIYAAVADLNNDGNFDLVVANQGQSGGSGSSISVLLGKGDGTFQAAVNYAAGVRPHGVAIGDFNEDGKLDLAVANEGVLQGDENPFVTFSNSSVSVLLGKGDGTFKLPSITTREQAPVRWPWLISTRMAS